MKTTDYKKGDVVILSDVGRDARFEYLGEAGCTRHAYRPLDGKTEFATMKTDAVGEFAPFPNKVAVKAVKRKWYQKIANWWKASNRWKHFLFAIPLGAVCGAPFTTGVGLGMEIKGHLYGGRADFVDFLLTAVGGVIGYGVMVTVGLDYGISLLINLIL